MWDVLTFPPVWLFAIPAGFCWALVFTQPTNAQPPPLVTWEMQDTISRDTAKDLAARGWEPYGITEAGGITTYALKRRR